MAIQRLGKICGALALGMFAVPSAAQLTVPYQAPPTQQTSPEAPSPTLPQAAPEAPPPFVPMPRRAPRHRSVKIGQPRARHAHQATHHRHRHAHRQQHHGSARATARTIRWCGHMTERQMMRHSACRALLGLGPRHSARRHHATQHRRHAGRHHRR